MSNPPIPDKIKIGTVTYRIQFADEIKKYQKDQDDSTVGCVDVLNQVIYVKKDLPKDGTREIVIHEILHSIWYSHGLTALDLDEELIVSILGPAVTQLVLENKELFRTLFDL